MRRHPILLAAAVAFASTTTDRHSVAQEPIAAEPANTYASPPVPMPDFCASTGRSGQQVPPNPPPAPRQPGSALRPKP